MSKFVLPELNAMQQIAEATGMLTPAERRRVAVWFTEYVAQDNTATTEAAIATAQPASEDDTVVEPNSLPAATPAEGPVPTPEPNAMEPEEIYPATDTPDYTTFAELYEAVAPKKGAQKAAVAGWWLEMKQGQQSWKASEVNKLLKSIDVHVSSMSIVLTNAVKARNPLMVELARLGDGERSRKTFCLSEAGFAYVEGALA